MTIHTNGHAPCDGEYYWAAAVNHGRNHPTIAPVKVCGTTPFLELVPPSGMFHSEWWLIEQIAPPCIEWNGQGRITHVCLAAADELRSASTEKAS